MNIYFYKAKNLAGEEKKGLYAAKSKAEVANMIQENGFFVANIRASIYGQLLELIIRYSVGIKNIAIFCRQFSILLNAGIPVVECLDMLGEQVKNRYLRRAIYGIKIQIINGQTLAEACESSLGVFPKFFNQMIKIGESTGNLDLILEKLGDYYDKLKDQKDKVKSSLMYPCLLVIVTIVVFYFVSTNVLPIFLNIFEQAGIVLPYSTRILIFICKNIKKLFLSIIISFIFMIVIISNLNKTDEGYYFFCKLKLYMPILGHLNRKMFTGIFLNNLSILQSSGLSLLKALEVCKKVSNNRIYQQEITKMIEGVQLGRRLSELMDENLFPQIIIKMIKIGEETGKLESMLNNSSLYCEKEVEITLERLLILVEPFVILLIASIIGFIVIGITLPMLDIYSFL